MSLSDKKTILLLGDSLIEYGHWEDYLKPYNAINLGLAGETIEGLLDRLSSVLERFSDVWLYVFMSGINNVAMDDYGFVPLYQKILRDVKQSSPSSHIIVCGLLPVNLEWVDNRRIMKLNQEIRSLCHSEGVQFLDLYNEFITTEGSPKAEYLLDDGVHLSDEGYIHWSRLLINAIKGLEGQSKGL
ncbi:MAG: hypothetical protein D6778_08005 [Nitrospirae bacterium]|nr:MAG: hypothetical protein D6778_08005 [Nitrospirota bacterium]